MGLINIPDGSVAKASDLRNNFDYLNSRITNSTGSIEQSISTVESSLQTTNGNVSSLQTGLSNLSTSTTNSINSLSGQISALSNAIGVAYMATIPKYTEVYGLPLNTDVTIGNGVSLPLKHGFVLFYTKVYGQSNWWINGVLLGNNYGFYNYAGVGWQDNNSALFPVKIGDVVRMDANTNGIDANYYSFAFFPQGQG